MTSLPIVTRLWRNLRPLPTQCPYDLHTLWYEPHKLPRWVADAPLVSRYLDLLGPLHWEQFPERDLLTQRGMPPVPFVPYVAACLIKLDQHLRYFSTLRQFLLDQPALAWILGFPVGRDHHHSLVHLPSQRHFSRLLHKIPNASLQVLLSDTVQLLRHALAEPAPHFGDTIALDTKHILAWVKENNPRAYVKDRFAPERQPADPDCRLGCKRKRNRAPDTTAPPTPNADPQPANTLAVSEFYWGYASGIVTTQVSAWGEFVLAELTQPFNCSDVTYFAPLMTAVEQRLGFRPHFAALDAAYDAFYIYEYFHREDEAGFAAVPLVPRGGAATRSFDEAGLPLCAADLAMPLKNTFMCKSARVPHKRGRYVCPLQYPARTADACPINHKQWAEGGCRTTLPTSIGARLRYQLDRDSVTYQQVYKQRTAPERIFSLAKELGIERPKLRNGAAIANLNTLIYILLNLRALQRIQQRKVALKT